MQYDNLLLVHPLANMNKIQTLVNYKKTIKFEFKYLAIHLTQIKYA